MSYRVYHFDDEFASQFQGRYIPPEWDNGVSWNVGHSSIKNRSIKDRRLVFRIGEMDPASIQLRYYFDPESEWPYIGRIELFFVGDPYRYPGLVEHLVRETAELSGEDGELEWVSHDYQENRICRLKPSEEIEGWNFTDYMKRMMEIFDPLFASYAKAYREHRRFIAYGKGSAFDKEKARARVSLSYDIVKIAELDFSALSIPPYQRTYKWERKNVNQLINDIRDFTEGESYRLGTLILHNGDIVDGQQRIVTLALILSQLFRIPEIKNLVNDSAGTYKSLYDSVVGFWDRTKYQSKTALGNILRNLDLINGRRAELTLDFFHTLVDRCEFVIVKLQHQGEAFQFFDSQNARGKDLAPHDLLKAFHLREIPDNGLTRHDEENVTAWQKIQTETLEDLFLTLFRIKRWSKGLSAREFTKDDIGAFKGISVTGVSEPDLPLYRPAYHLTRLFSEKDPSHFPFQIDSEIVNGSLFFDMIRHYYAIRESMYKPETLENHPRTQHLLTLLDHYDKRNRIGDTYIRSLFDALMVYYVDKFGYGEIDRISEHLFLYAYKIRLVNSRVSIATVDNEVLNGTMFRAIRDAAHPLDILNVEIESFEADKDCSLALKEEFRKHHKLTNP